MLANLITRCESIRAHSTWRWSFWLHANLSLSLTLRSVTLSHSTWHSWSQCNTDVCTPDVASCPTRPSLFILSLHNPDNRDHMILHNIWRCAVQHWLNLWSLWSSALECFHLTAVSSLLQLVFGVYNYNLQLFTFNCNLSFGAPTDIAKLASTYVIWVQSAAY